MCTNFCRFRAVWRPHTDLVEEQHELVLANVKQEYIDFCSEGKLFSQWQAQNPGQTLNEFTVMQFKVFVVENLSFPRIAGSVHYLLWHACTD